MGRAAERANLFHRGAAVLQIEDFDGRALLREPESDLRSDEWVRDNALDAEPSPIPAPPSRVLAVGASMTIDLSAERSLMEAMTLSFTLPFALGWFWWANTIARRQRVWDA